MSSVIVPDATIGILGGGQLGRMTATAARSLGFRVHALDPDPACPARYVVERCVTASFDDAAAAADLARHCSVVTLEIEKVSLASLRAAEAHAPVRPGADVLAIVQDRAKQKAWLVKHGLPVGRYEEARTAEELDAALGRIGAPAFVKACSGGYDGRGQVPVKALGDGVAAAAFTELGGGPVVVEAGLDLEAELSVMVARSPRGETAVYPPALNHHEERILDWSVLPGTLPPDIVKDAMAMAEAIASGMGVVGLVATEFFLTKGGKLLVNELSPRPHNSFHATEMACVTSQFEQVVRAVCNLPLGSVSALRAAAIVNLLGDLWQGTQPPAFEEALAVPGVRLFLYGKSEARPGRKMGHLCAVGDTAEEAVRRVKEARERLSLPRP